MTTRRITIAALAVFSITAGMVDAQTTTTQKTPGAKQVSEATSVTGTVVAVEGNWLLARMEPKGYYQFFNVPPGRQFFIDGQPKLLSDLKPGVVLTATVITTTQPVTERTTTVTNGTVWYVSGDYVVLTLENGETRDYTVPPSVQFVVEGKPATVKDLKKGMRVSATKIVEQPKAEFSTTVVVTGRSAK
jgi:hypothetical protein